MNFELNELFFIMEFILLAGVLKEIRNGMEKWDCNRWNGAEVGNRKMDTLLYIIKDY